LGSRLNIRQVSYSWQKFAPNSFKIQVDADPAELAKPTVKCDFQIRCDLRVFLEELTAQVRKAKWDAGKFAGWLAWCRQRRERYPGVTPKMRAPGPKINPYVLFETLFKILATDDVVVCGNGSACVMPFQVGEIKRGMRMFCNSGSASMGYDLPAAIGAAVARHGKRVICLAGDGSVMFNLQELQTIAHHRLCIKVFVISNEGYLSMRTTQMNFFKGNLVGEGPRSGVTFPDFVKVGEAFNIPSERLSNPSEMEKTMERFLSTPGPGLIDVVVDPDQLFEPKLAARQLPDGKIVSPSLEDMWPFLSKEELESNMIARSAG
jgi:acetolactate synthase-1/2/3 large subunit